LLSELDRRRLDHAKLLLLETSLTVEDIAERSGFRHCRWFHVLFRKTLGTSPAAYRRRHWRPAAGFSSGSNGQSTGQD
jgi:transcriptional regulator GlxA family with amidase domain